MAKVLEIGYWKKDIPKKIKKDFVAAIVQSDSLLEDDLVLSVVDQQKHHSEQ